MRSKGGEEEERRSDWKSESGETNAGRVRRFRPPGFLARHPFASLFALPVSFSLLRIYYKNRDLLQILSRPEIISINLDHRGTDKYERYCAASLRPYHRDDQFPSAFFLCLSGFATEFSIRQPDPLLTEDLPGDFLCYTVLDFPSGIFPWSTKLHIYSNSTMSLFGQCPQGRAHNPSSRTVPIYQNKRSPA